jgi:prophage tail gpP-like protein
MDVPRSRLPKGVKEGTWLQVEIQGDKVIDAKIDEEETNRAKQRIAEKLAALRRGDHLKKDS